MLDVGVSTEALRAVSELIFRRLLHLTAWRQKGNDGARYRTRLRGWLIGLGVAMLVQSLGGCSILDGLRIGRNAGMNGWPSRADSRHNA